MKILTLHCDYLKFKPLKKAIKQPEELSKEQEKEKKVEEVLAVFTAVEKQDEQNKNIVSELVNNVKEIAKQVGTKNIVLYPYAHLSSNLSNPIFAQEVLKDAEKGLKKEKYEVERAPFGYYKEFELKCKGHPLSELSREIKFETIFFPYVLAMKKAISEPMTLPI
jgi:threonyl-tRNA synthetase